MKKIKIAFLMAAMAASIILVACSQNPKRITTKQVASMAQSYFHDIYGMDIVTESVRYEQTNLKKYRNIVTVSDGDTEYELVLNENNKPSFDNVSAVKTLENANISALEEKMSLYGLKEYNFKGVKWYYSFDEKSCITNFDVGSRDRPSRDSMDGIYSFLGELRNEGIDKLVILISTPDFLSPKAEPGYKPHGLLLEGEFYKTDIDQKSFEEQHESFINRIYWDEKKFEEKISELNQMGYENAYFYILQWRIGSTLEIVLYCESDGSLTDEQAIAAISNMDDSYIKIGENDTAYVLRHEIK